MIARDHSQNRRTHRQRVGAPNLSPTTTSAAGRQKNRRVEIGYQRSGRRQTVSPFPADIEAILMIGEDPGLKARLSETPPCETADRSASGSAEALQFQRLRSFDQDTDPGLRCQKIWRYWPRCAGSAGNPDFCVDRRPRLRGDHRGAASPGFAIFAAPFNHAEIADMVVEGLQTSTGATVSKRCLRRTDCDAVACHQVTRTGCALHGEMQETFPRRAEDLLMLSGRCWPTRWSTAEVLIRIR